MVLPVIVLSKFIFAELVLAPPDCGTFASLRHPDYFGVIVLSFIFIWYFFLQYGLTFIEGFIETIQFNQFPVGSVLHQLALIEYQNPIGLL